MSLKKYLLRVISVLIFVSMCACNVFNIPDTSKDTELKKKADNIMTEIDSLIIDLDNDVIIEIDSMIINLPNSLLIDTIYYHTIK